jgi:catechol 2,3-dioxygenase
MWRGARTAIVSGMTIDPRAQIGHVHLKVADLDRALNFYREVLGFNLTGRVGDQFAFVAAGGYHHHVGLNTLDRPHTGLYHAAIRYPTREALANALQHIRRHDYPVSHGSDHGASESIYLADPDGNGIELYWDRPVQHWPRTPDGELALVNLPLDLETLSR